MENVENNANGSESAAASEFKIIRESDIQDMRDNDLNREIFKKSTYWHQQSSDIQKINIESLLKEISECLLRMEAKLNNIEASTDK